MDDDIENNSFSLLFLSIKAVVHDHKIFTVPVLLKQASVIPIPHLPLLEKVCSIEVLGNAKELFCYLVTTL